MTLAKHIIHALVAVIRKELTIQKPTAEQMTTSERHETRQQRIFKTGMNGFAMIFVIIVVMSVLVL